MFFATMNSGKCNVGKKGHPDSNVMSNFGGFDTIEQVCLDATRAEIDDNVILLTTYLG